MNTTPFSATIIEASAGTGKTHRLVSEFMRLAEDGDLPRVVRHCLAVTFSEAAACELKERILAVLERNKRNRSKSAAELGISRRTLIRKLNAYRGQGLLDGGGDDEA